MQGHRKNWATEPLDSTKPHFGHGQKVPKKAIFGQSVSSMLNSQCDRRPRYSLALCSLRSSFHLLVHHRGLWICNDAQPRKRVIFRKSATLVNFASNDRLSDTENTGCISHLMDDPDSSGNRLPHDLTITAFLAVWPSTARIVISLIMIWHACTFIVNTSLLQMIASCTILCFPSELCLPDCSLWWSGCGNALPGKTAFCFPRHPSLPLWHKVALTLPKCWEDWTRHV